ncbi:competence type IV pilus minor pilin ComGG [Peribacillus simplex]|uniref:competence type IV pilus minor pilin ComGG n=1 Tax=Peribacillus simplex TaxID=1478 RepID=UPI00298D6339|nr:competence type IV pilus minor pilin ComGG [Peribacillus simplex]MDW7614566.1 competence type IV pilus minor pilin ComGG [Peribacillus simplex]
MNNQKGVVFPIVMIVASVFIMLTILMIDQFILDKRFYKEVEESLVADHLVHLAVKDVTEELGEVIPDIIQGEISYPNGVVRYSLTKQDGHYVYLEFSSTTKNGRVGRVIIQYDKEAGRVIEWIEKQAM